MFIVLDFLVIFINNKNIVGLLDDFLIRLIIVCNFYISENKKYKM